MEKILNGCRHFRNVIYPTQKATFERLAREQKPMALFIVCSDARVHPNLITNTDPGDLFILRNPGNIVPPYSAAGGVGEAATIEYAVGVLGIRHVIVCGHSNCGAMTCLVKPEALNGFSAVSSWLTHAEATRRIVLSQQAGQSQDELVASAVKRNVLVQISNLHTHPVVAAGVAAGKVEIHGWVYDIGSGQIDRYRADDECFVPLLGDEAAARA